MANGLLGTGRVDYRKQARSVVDELHNLAADVEDMVRDTAGVSDAQLDSFKERFATRLSDTRQRMVDVAAPVADRAADGWRQADDYVHDRPWAAIGIGAAIGIALGVMLSRRG